MTQIQSLQTRCRQNSVIQDKVKKTMNSKKECSAIKYFRLFSVYEIVIRLSTDSH